VLGAAAVALALLSVPFVVGALLVRWLLSR
jgi:hypothetical protein